MKLLQDSQLHLANREKEYEDKLRAQHAKEFVEKAHEDVRQQLKIFQQYGLSEEKAFQDILEEVKS